MCFIPDLVAFTSNTILYLSLSDKFAVDIVVQFNIYACIRCVMTGYDQKNYKNQWSIKYTNQKKKIEHLKNR